MFEYYLIVIPITTNYHDSKEEDIQNITSRYYKIVYNEYRIQEINYQKCN